MAASIHRSGVWILSPPPVTSRKGRESSPFFVHLLRQMNFLNGEYHWQSPATIYAKALKVHRSAGMIWALMSLREWAKYALKSGLNLFVWRRC